MKKTIITNIKHFKNAIKVKREFDENDSIIKKTKISDEFASSLFQSNPSSTSLKYNAYAITSEIEYDNLPKNHHSLIVIVPKNVTDPLGYIKNCFLDNSSDEKLEEIQWKIDKLDNNFASISNDILDSLSEIKTAKKDYLKYIKDRQREGIDKAKAEGKHLGRPKLEKPDGWDEIYQLWKNEEITAIDAMKRLNLKKSSFYKLVHQQEEN